MNYLISFCVVTCDQPIELERLLNSMIKQDLDDIEIIIRDDSEGCESQLVVNKYSKTIPIRYYKMKKEGIDIAISYVVGVSRGLYVWLFGDDVLSRKSFNMLKDKLKSFDYPDFIYLNSSSVQNDNIKSISVKSDLISYDRNNFLLMIKDQLGFLSALVFNSKIISDAIKSDKSVVGTHWLNLYSSIYSLANGNKFLYLSDSYFLSDEKPAGEKRWYDSFTTHAISFSFIANKFQDDFSKNTIRKLIKYKFDMSWKAVIVERAKGYHTGFASHSPKAKKMLISFWMYPNCYVALVLFAVPRKILSYMYCLYRCTMR